jgi:hypothetical protein
MNAVLEDGKNKAGAYEASMGTAGKQLNSMTRYVEDLKVKMGNAFLETFTNAVFGQTDALKKLGAEMDKLAASGDIQRWGHDLAETVGTGTNAVKDSVSWLWKHREAVAAIAGIYATVKIASWLGPVITQTAAATAATVEYYAALASGRVVTLGSAQAEAQKAAAVLRTAELNLAAIVTEKALADARVQELRASVLAADGATALAITTNGLIPAQAKSAALSEAQTIATNDVARANIRAAETGEAAKLSSIGLGAGVAALGGPIGIIITVLGLAATAWAVFGSTGKSAISEVNDEIEKGISIANRYKKEAQFGTGDAGQLAASLEAVNKRIEVLSQSKGDGASKLLKEARVQADALTEALNKANSAMPGVAPKQSSGRLAMLATEYAPKATFADTIALLNREYAEEQKLAAGNSAKLLEIKTQYETAKKGITERMGGQVKNEYYQALTNAIRELKSEQLMADKVFANDSAITARNVALRGYTTEMESAAKQSADYAKAENARIVAIKEADLAYKKTIQTKDISASGKQEALDQLNAAKEQANAVRDIATSAADILKTNTDIAASQKIALDISNQQKAVRSEIEAGYQDQLSLTNAQLKLESLSLTSTVAQSAEKAKQAAIAEANHAFEYAANEALITQLERIEQIKRSGATDPTSEYEKAGEAYLLSWKAALRKRNTAISMADVNAKTAIAQDWRNTSDQINKDLTDALMRGFESGKGFSENLRDTLTNMFKTMVLRPIISAVVTDVTGLGGISGTGGAGGSAGNILNSLSTAASWMTNDGFSANMGNQFNKLGNNLIQFGDKLDSTGNGPVSQFGTYLSENAANLGKYTSKLADLASYAQSAQLASEGKWGQATYQAAGTAIGGPILGQIAGQIGKLVDDFFAKGRFGGDYVQSTGYASKTYTADGVGSTNTIDYGGGFNPQGMKITASATAFSDGMESAYLKTIRALGGTAQSTAFGVSGNSTGTSVIVGGAAGTPYRSAEFKTDDKAAAQLEFSRALLDGLKSSTMPEYLARVFSEMVPKDATQEAINTAIGFAEALKTTRDALLETRAPLEILTQTVATGIADLHTSAASFKTDFVAAIDAGLTPESFATWQALGANMQAAAGAAKELQNANDGWYQKITTLVTPALQRQYDKQRDLGAATDATTRSLIEMYYGQLDVNDANKAAATLQKTNSDFYERLTVANGSATQRQYDKQHDLASATDDTTRNLIDWYYAQLDVNDATEKARVIAEETAARQQQIAAETLSAQQQIAVLTGKSTQAEIERTNALLAANQVDPSGEVAKLVSTLYDLKDAATSAADAASRLSLSNQMAVALGSSTQFQVAQSTAGAALSKFQSNKEVGGLTEAQVMRLLSDNTAFGALSKTAQTAVQEFATASVTWNNALNSENSRTSSQAPASASAVDGASKIASAFQAVTSAQKSYAGVLNDTIKSMKSFRDSINQSDDPLRNFALAREKFLGLQARVNAGDTSAIVDLQSTAQDFLALSKDYSSTAIGYTRDQAMVTSTLDQVIGTAQTSLADLPKEFSAALDPTKDALVALTTAIKDYNTTYMYQGYNPDAAPNIGTRNMALPVRSFAVGTDYVPHDGLAMIHKGEAVVPAAFNPARYSQGKSEGALLEEVKALRQEIVMLRSEARATAINTGDTNKKLDRVMPDQDAIQTRAAP